MNKYEENFKIQIYLLVNKKFTGKYYIRKIIIGTAYINTIKITEVLPSII